MDAARTIASPQLLTETNEICVIVVGTAGVMMVGTAGADLWESPAQRAVVWNVACLLAAALEPLLRSATTYKFPGLIGSDNAHGAHRQFDCARGESESPSRLR